MIMMDPAVLASMLGKVQEAAMTLEEYRHKLAASGLPQRFIWANAKHHDGKLKARSALVDMMGFWGGYQKAAGYDDRAIQRLFWHKFNLDVLSAQTLDANGCEELISRIAMDLTDPSS